MPKSYAPKRSNSFYGSVVEDMLDSVSSDISSTHYSRRRDTIRGDKSSPRRSLKSTSVVSPDTSMVESGVKVTSHSEAHGDVKISNLPSPRLVFIVYITDVRMSLSLEQEYRKVDQS